MKLRDRIQGIRPLRQIRLVLIAKSNVNER